jgi:ABC-type antimicrobial peptide transport system permease subunit
MLLLAASLSVACALTATIWQRRPRLAALKMHGYGHGQLWGAVLVESAASILGGCALGALLGVGGHALASRFVRSAAGFPVSFSLGPAQALLTVALFCAVAMAVIALPGAAATAVPPRMALQE